MDYHRYLKRFNFAHQEFPRASDPKARRWFPFYIGNGDLGMLLDPLGTNILRFKFEYDQGSGRIFSGHALPTLSANDAFLCKDIDEKDYKKDPWSGKPIETDPTAYQQGQSETYSLVRGFQVQVDTGIILPEDGKDLSDKTSDYRQEVDLWDGVCRTHLLYDNALEIQVDTLISWSDTRVGVIKYSIINKNHASREISLHNKLACKYYGTDVVFRETQGFQYAEVSTQACRIGLAYACEGDRGGKYPSEEKIILGKDEKTERVFYFSLTSDAVKGILPEDAVRHAGEVKARGYAASFDKHAEAVHDFWKKWRVMVPDENIADLYYKSMWIIAGSIGNYYPPSPTTIANPSYLGRGFGDYLIPYHVLIQTGHFDKVGKTEKFFFDALPKDQERGFLFPGVWPQYIPDFKDININNDVMWSKTGDNVMSLNMGWIPWIFHTRYCLTGDENFLKEKVYPLMKAVSIFIAETVSKTAEGYEYLAEKEGKKQNFYSIDEPAICPSITGKPVDNPADLMTAVKWALQTTAEVAGILGADKKMASQWREISSGMIVPQNNKYYIGCKGDDIEKRATVYTPAVLMGVYPIPLLEDGKIEQTYAIIVDKLAKSCANIPNLNIQAWCKGLWQQVARMRLSKALDYLIYDSVWRWNYGLSLDRAQLSESSEKDGRPFPCFYYLQTHAAVAGAVNEIMLQSHKGIIKVFPCVPTRWKNKNLSFNGLFAEVGFKVSSKYENGEIPRIEMESLAGAKCRLELPLEWRSAMIKDENNGSIPHTIEKVKTRIDGKERMADVIAFNTVCGGKYVVSRP